MWFPRKYNTPVRMHGHALPVREITLQRGRREQDYSEDVLLPRRITGHEAIGQLFEYRIEAVRSVPHPEWFATDEFEVDLDAIKGSAITLTFKDVFTRTRDWREPRDRERTGLREITGMVAEAGILDIEGNDVVYEFVLRPQWWCATLRKNSRIFIHTDITNILCTILKSYSHDIDFRCGEHPTPRRDFIRQAWETDWDFCMRLCEEFGYLIWFEHREGRHFLVIADSIRACKAQTPPYATLSYRPKGGHLDREYVTHLSWRTSVALNRVVVHDHSYISPRLSANSAPYREQHSIRHGDGQEYVFDCERIESYEPAEYAQPETTHYRTEPVESPGPQEAKVWRGEAQHLARVKLEAARCGRMRAKGRGALRGIEAGRTFTLTDHPHAGANDTYFVLDCRIDIRNTQGLSSKLDGAAAKYEFEAQFELHPTREPYRMPQVTPRPRIDGYEHAVIVGWEQHPMTVDAYNRVRIQYAWDREGNHHGNTSIWVRLALPWQGDGMGVVMHGRPGQEVLVAYVNGDPDRPVVAAFVPNQDNMPPWKLPDNRALTGIVSRTLGNGGASNHLALDDTDNRQQAQLASDHGKSSLSLGYVTRIAGNEGRQDARGEGFELRTDMRGAVRAGLGLIITTIAKLGAAGKILDMRETIARLTRARDIHERLAQQAQRHGAQDAGSDQSGVTANMQRDNAELRGKPSVSTRPGGDDFPEFEAPHLTISSGAGIQTAAAGSTHIASDENTALTTGGHVSIATGKSFFASVREQIVLFAQKAIRLHAESDEMTLIAGKGISVTSEEETIHLGAAKRIILTAGGSRLEIGPDGIRGYTSAQFLVHAQSHATDGPMSVPSHTAPIAPYPVQLSCSALAAVMPAGTGPGENAVQASAPAPTPAPTPAQQRSAGELKPAGDAPPAFDGALAGASGQSSSGTARIIPVNAASDEPCEHTLQNIPVSTVTWDMETGNYWGLLENGQPWLDATGERKFVQLAGARGTFDIGFDRATRTIAMRVIVLVVPMRVRQVDPANPKAVEYVPYESAREHDDNFSATFIKEPRPAKEITNLSAMKSTIEAFLNANSYKLAIRNCPKAGAASDCKAQVAVKFEIDFVTKADERHHAQVNLYPSANRADSGNWGELNVRRNKTNTAWEPIPNEHVQQHETGHLFSFPDEYFDQGGAVHKSHIDAKTQTVKFADAVASADKNTWQGIGRTTLMGPGVYTPGVKVPSYYLNRVKHWFSTQTGWDWVVVPHIQA
ncbi:type VI secretion system tip protein TssI/VgrG [Paraburkholderia sp. A3BS-1L]|uniref:type VI secretion system Vgr family protein n=1 Tax=Paraburkholderia sp. A3BS-1L TaxID=3028375 RepID=UPI003DAA2A72